METNILLIIIMMSVHSGIVQRLTPVIADILDKIIRRVLAGILGKITGEKSLTHAHQQRT